jgi:carbon monoxide dehydrogenase subunit G
VLPILLFLIIKLKKMTTSINKVFVVEHGIDEVWNNLTNPSKIVNCVPGASLTEQVDENNFKGKVQLKFGPVKAGYDGLITFTERDAAAKKMSLKGMGVDEKGKGNAEMKMDGVLTEKTAGATEVSISMDISITGMLAQFGSRLITDVSNSVFDQFVHNFKALLDGKAFDNTLSAGSMAGSLVKGIFGGHKS